MKNGTLTMNVHITEISKGISSNYKKKDSFFFF